jgi:D-alanyl-D-alanine carboxypeptidase (penicillin-binding protein 5/6)
MKPRALFALGFGLLAAFTIGPLWSFAPAGASLRAPDASAVDTGSARVQAAAPPLRVRGAEGFSGDKPGGGPAMPVMAASVVSGGRRPALGNLPPPHRLGSLAPPAVTAPVYVVLDDASGQVLFEHDGDLRVAPASLTKIATAVVALENADLNEVVTTTVDGHDMGDSSVMGLYPVDLLSLQDLLYGLLLPSGNDAAIQIAQVVGGDEANFVRMMNDLARHLGLRNTHFVNPHGLDDPEHYSSAYDLAVLARYAMGNPTFRKIVGTRSYIARGFQTYPLYNTNPLLGRYEGLDGVKTGLTDNAGQTYVASATRDGHRVYASFVMSQNRAADAVPLLDFAFAMYRWPSLRLLPLGPIP